MIYKPGQFRTLFFLTRRRSSAPLSPSSSPYIRLSLPSHPVTMKFASVIAILAAAATVSAALPDTNANRLAQGLPIKAPKHRRGTPVNRMHLMLCVSDLP